MSTALAMEDIGKFGLGLTSLLVDYTHACIRNVVTAANDASSIIGCRDVDVTGDEAPVTAGASGCRSCRSRTVSFIGQPI
jgi:hypothetical protein